MDEQNWKHASTVYRNLADLHAQLGALEASAEAARQALDLARKAVNKQDEMTSLSWQGTAFHLLGKANEAKLAFQESEQVEKAMQHGAQYLFSYAGIRHADHLHRTGDLDYARRVTQANLQICEQNHFAYTPGMCHRVLGDLDFDEGNYQSTRIHYDTALKRARSESVRRALIEALPARGRFAAKLAVGAGGPRPIDTRPGSGDPTPTVDDAFTDLDEALTYAVEGGYRIYKADIRVALAWAWLAQSKQSSVDSNQSVDRAKAEATRALQMSKEMGYHWGKVDAKEILERIEIGE
jgi:tetratricopeptide (TPR) repeat protein